MISRADVADLVRQTEDRALIETLRRFSLAPLADSEIAEQPRFYGRSRQGTIYAADGA